MSGAPASPRPARALPVPGGRQAPRPRHLRGERDNAADPQRRHRLPRRAAGLQRPSAPDAASLFPPTSAPRLSSLRIGRRSARALTSSAPSANSSAPVEAAGNAGRRSSCQSPRGASVNSSSLEAALRTRRSLRSPEPPNCSIFSRQKPSDPHLSGPPPVSFYMVSSEGESRTCSSVPENRPPTAAASEGGDWASESRGR